MNFLKKLFGSNTTRSDSSGVFFYIQADRTAEVIPVRLNRHNDLSLTDDGEYYVRKIVMGQKSFDRIEAEFFFDKKRQFRSADIIGGTLVERQTYEVYLAESSAPVDDSSEQR